MVSKELIPKVAAKAGTKSAIAADLNCISFGTAMPPCEVKDMDDNFMQKLLFAQKIYGKKLRINSAFRSVVYEKSMGRSGLSQHTKGLAVDIKTPTHLDRLQILYALISAGVRRFGIAKTFIHCDDAPDKVPTIWLYNPDDLSKTF